jgi:integrase/recombinase XerD
MVPRARRVLIAHRLAGQCQPDPVAAYLARLMPNSRPKIRERLRMVARSLTGGLCNETTLNWSALRYSDTVGHRGDLQGRCGAGTMAPATANAALSALRCVLKECWRLGLMPAEDYQRAVDVPRIKGQAAPAGHALTTTELRSLFDICRPHRGVVHLRDLALFVTLAASGMRRAEAVALMWPRDCDLASGTLTIRYGKGGKRRQAWLDDASWAVLRDWISVRGSWTGPLFCAVDRGRHIVQRGITPDTVREILQRRAEQAGIARCSPHDLRKTFSTTVWKQTGDLESLRRLLGHSKLETTQGYLRDDDQQAARRAAASVRLPLQLKGTDDAAH